MRVRGVSLIEGLIAGLLLSLTLLVIVSLYPQTLLGMRQARELDQATYLAQQALEDLRTLPFGEVREGARWTEVCNGVSYEVETRVVEREDRLKEISAEVTWSFPGQTSREGRRMSVHFDSCLFRFPP